MKSYFSSLPMRLEILLHGPLEMQRRRANQRTVQVAQQPAREPLTTLFVGDSGSRVVHETKADGSILRAAAPEIDAVDVLDALVAVMAWRHQSQWRAVRNR